MKPALQPAIISQRTNRNQNGTGYDRRKYLQATEPFVRNEDQPAEKAEDTQYFDHADSIQRAGGEGKLNGLRVQRLAFGVHSARLRKSSSSSIWDCRTHQWVLLFVVARTQSHWSRRSYWSYPSPPEHVVTIQRTPSLAESHVEDEDEYEDEFSEPRAVNAHRQNAKR